MLLLVVRLLQLLRLRLRRLRLRLLLRLLLRLRSGQVRRPAVVQRGAGRSEGRRVVAKSKISPA